jgi:hypothetical protein
MDNYSYKIDNLSTGYDAASSGEGRKVLANVDDVIALLSGKSG